MPIQREKSQSTSVGEFNLKPFIAVTYKNRVPSGATANPEKELRQILQMLQRLSVLHPEQFLHDRNGCRRRYRYVLLAEEDFAASRDLPCKELKMSASTLAASNRARFAAPDSLPRIEFTGKLTHPARRRHRFSQYLSCPAVHV